MTEPARDPRGVDAAALAAIVTPPAVPAALLDEAARPSGPAPAADEQFTLHGVGAAQHLVDVHDHLRGELEQVRAIVAGVMAGDVTIGDARGAMHQLVLTKHDWRVGALCASYCRMVEGHHGLEDRAIFPHLRASANGLAPVIDQLEAEHLVIHEVLEGVDRALVRLGDHPGELAELQAAFDTLAEVLLSHLSYEEHELVAPLARHGFYAGQL